MEDRIYLKRKNLTSIKYKSSIQRIPAPYIPQSSRLKRTTLQYLHPHSCVEHTCLSPTMNLYQPTKIPKLYKKTDQMKNCTENGKRGHTQTNQHYWYYENLSTKLSTQQYIPEISTDKRTTL